MMRGRVWRRLAASILILCIVPGFLIRPPCPTAAEEGEVPSSSAGGTDFDWMLPAYTAYIQQHEGAQNGSGAIRVNAGQYADASGVEAVTREDGVQVLKTTGESKAEWIFQIPESGFYNLTVRYCPIPSETGFSNSIERAVTVNGETPYQECSYVVFSRSYSDAGEAQTDTAGNDVRPQAEENAVYRDYTLRDPVEYIAENLRFYLEEGENRIGLTGVKGDMLLEWLELSVQESAVPYKDYLQKAGDLPDTSAQAEPIRLEAEKTSAKSDFTIVSVNDRTSAGTQPSSASKLKLNAIGGSNWKTAGQWLEWKFTVEQAGFYTFVLRSRQDVYPGAVSTRRLRLDGEVPFREAEAIAFAYDNQWKTEPLSLGGEPLRFYLEPGEHTLTLEVVLGEMAPILSEVSAALDSLNQDYLRIITYTGTSPDIYRLYNFDKLIPDVLEDMARQRDALLGTLEEMGLLSGRRGQNTAILEQLISLLGKMTEDPDTIARHFTTFKDALAALGTWLTTYSEQPLQLDSIVIQPADAPLPENSESFFQNLWFQTKVFLYSFLDDYSTAGSLSDSGYDEEHRLTVWTASGRDQSEIIQRLSDDSFTPESGYKVDLRLVASNALLPNILAGTPIDVYLTAAASDPVNYAIRGAVVDLTEFADLEEVVSQFHPAALVPFTYQDHVYALPESLNFPVLFYRKDVFAQYGLEVPTTWSEFYENVSLLQKNRMTVGFNWTQAFSIFLYQSGGQYYNGEGTASALDSNEGMRAFQRVAELYTTYGLPVQFDFANRFRSGEMPMGIVDYNMYNQLTVFAPEIKGLWAFAPLPGTQDENGEINNVSPCTGNAAIMPRCVSNKEGAWEFLKWWTGAEAQTRYGIEMETVLGPSAKQPSANLEAVANLPWTAQEFNTLKTQWDHLAGTPEIPGSYYTARSLDFAFNSVYSLGQDAIEALEENVLLINEEIQRKLKEFDKAH